MNLFARTDASEIPGDPFSAGIAGDVWLYFPGNQLPIRVISWSHRVRVPVEIDADLAEALGIARAAFISRSWIVREQLKDIYEEQGISLDRALISTDRESRAPKNYISNTMLFSSTISTDNTTLT